MSKKSKILGQVGIKGSRLTGIRNVRKNLRKVSYANPLLRVLSYPKISALYLEVSSKCNLNCKMCTYKKEHASTGFMSWSLFKKCVDEASILGVKEVLLHFGGESLLHPQFKEYLKYAVDHRDHGGIQKVSWIDNGMLFNEDMANLVVALKVDAIGFSIDGVGALNDSIRLGAKYSVIERNIKYLLKKRANAKPEVFLSMCSYGKTEEQLMDVYREWTQHVDRITLIPSISSDNSIDNRENFLKGSKMVQPPSFCTYPFDLMAVSWTGEVTGCCLDYAFKLQLGDASKSSLRDIWKGSNYHALRKASLKNVFPPGPCHNCEFWKINFEPKEEQILDGKATMNYGYIYKTIKKNN
jgi:radical SAM protein with 4Fe4S-binding SPASM domain